MLLDLVEIAPQRIGQFVDLGTGFSSRLTSLQGFPQLIEQLGGERREIVDEIQRVLDLVRDASGELTERGELLGLHQTILRGPQILQGFSQFARASLHAFKQAHVLDRDHRLVGEGLDQLDLLVGKRPHRFALQNQSRRSVFPPAATARQASYGIPPRVCRACHFVIWIGQNVGDVNGLAFNHRTADTEPRPAR